MQGLKKRYFGALFVPTDKLISRAKPNAPFMYGGMASEYGEHGETVKEWASKGVVVMTNRMDGTGYYMANESDIQEIGFNNFKETTEIDGYRMGWSEDGDYSTVQQLEHDVRSARNKKKDKLEVGDQFHCGVGDGYASYVVTKVKRVNCTVEWRGFCADGYVDRLFGYGGDFRIKDVLPLTGKGFPKLFGKPKTEEELRATFDKARKYYEDRYKRVYEEHSYCPN